jgi:hypothetical protein
MSSPYNIKLQKVEDAIIQECKEIITENFNGAYFDMWLSIDASSEISDIYKTEFDKEFSQYISQDKATETTILYAGQNLTYFVSTIMDVTTSLSKIKKLVEKFIKAQIEDFDNACDYISMTMYDETHNSDGEPIEINAEDNPSSS